MDKCLICFLPVENNIHYHNRCAERLFGSTIIPELDFGITDLKKLAQKVVAKQANITGVQAKVSLSPVIGKHGSGKLAIDYKGRFILKPPAERFPGMPEVEAATMQMAEKAGIKVVPHGLIRMNDGILAYITRRVDRKNGIKIHQEDMCQLTERLTEDKYKSSCEQVGKAIARYVQFPKIDQVSFFQVVVFSFLHGNTDMHLKNYSLTHNEPLGMSLTPAYDLLNTYILLPDNEQSALTINGKKSNLKKSDFEALGNNMQLTSRQVNTVINQLIKAKPKFVQMIGNSFMNDDLKEAYWALLEQNYKVFEQD